MVSTLAKEVPWEKGFYFVPGFERYAINRNGTLKNLATNREITWVIWKGNKGKKATGGYRVTNIYNMDGKRKGVSRHRLLALAFKECPGYVDDYVVNHKDGIPGNDWLDNLEWVTYSENTKHAYDTGLHPNKLRPIIVRYWKTGEERKFRSIQDCVTELDIPFTTISSRLANANGVAYSDGLQIKRDDDTPWVSPNERMANVRTADDWKAICEKTGKVFLFDSVRQMALYLNLSYSMVQRKIAKGLPYKGYRFEIV